MLTRQLIQLIANKAADKLAEGEFVFSCTAIRHTACSMCVSDLTLAYWIASLYAAHSGARAGRPGFDDIPEVAWKALTSDERINIRIDRLRAFARANAGDERSHRIEIQMDTK